MLYEIKVKYKSFNAKGEEKDITEDYLYDCLLFSEAEAKALTEVNNGEVDVTAIKRSKIVEVVNEGEEPYFKAKIVDIFLDENGKEKENPYYLLCNAKDVASATKKFEEHLKQGMQDFRLDSVSKTKFLEIWK